VLHGWLALAEAEYERARGPARPESWSQAAAAWQRLERPPLTAYCHWRQTEALVAAGQKHGPEETLGLTPREAQVLNLLARGYTNREIAAELVISVKTASVHVSHILRKLGAPNRLEAAATISRLAPPPSGQSEPKT